MTRMRRKVKTVMNKKKIIPVIAALLLCCFVATGCSKDKEPVTLTGEYSAGTNLGATTYTFAEDEKVHYDYKVAGQTVVSVDGTYSINDDGDVITMVFPKEEIADVPVGVDVGGSFALEIDEDGEYVTLNGVLFSAEEQ